MSRYQLDIEWLVPKKGPKIPMTAAAFGGPTIYLDLCGTGLTQQILDIVTAEANSIGDCVNIVLRRVGTAYGGVPRLIADRGEIYDALAKLLKEQA